MRRSLLVLTFATLLLGVPEAAHAGTVRNTGNPPIGVATFDAFPGEINDREVHLTSHALSFTDAAFMIAGPGCTSTGFTSASCMQPQAARANMGDMDDHAI